jgi:hypothetical protein
MTIFKENNEVWDISCVLGREGDVEFEDDEFDIDDEEDETANDSKLPAEEPPEIFHQDDENMAVSECF